MRTALAAQVLDVTASIRGEMGFGVGRLRLLLDTFAPDDEAAWLARAMLFKQLVIAQSEMESVRPLLARGSRLVTSEITSRAARTGEHYITRSKKVWRLSMRRHSSKRRSSP